jgi:hypothetical protein
MLELLMQAVRLPNLPYTIFLVLILLYWISVIVGVLDVESLDGDLDIETDFEVEPEIETDVEVDAEADLDTEVSGKSLNTTNLASILNLGAVPLTVWLSFFGITAWMLSTTLNLVIDLITPINIHNFFRLLFGALIIVPVSGFITRFTVIPLKPVFTYKKATSNTDFLRETCIITSTKVTPAFGLAERKVDGTPIILNVRADESQGLAKGDKALIVNYNKEENTFEVAPFNYDEINLYKKGD